MQGSKWQHYTAPEAVTAARLMSCKTLASKC